MNHNLHTSDFDLSLDRDHSPAVADFPSGFNLDHARSLAARTESRAQEAVGWCTALRHRLDAGGVDNHIAASSIRRMIKSLNDEIGDLYVLGQWLDSVTQGQE